MSVMVDYFGRLGNNMFQYAAGRLMSELEGVDLGSQWLHHEVIDVSPEIKWRYIESGSEVVVDDSSNWEDIHGKYSKIRMHGYFQSVGLWNNHGDRVSGFWDLEPVIKNTQDIVIHLRLADYFSERVQSVINPNWYHSILREESFRKLYIVVAPHVTNKKYLESFRVYNPVIVSDTPKHDFNFIRSFDRIICANSSFSWWAAYLSDASKVYTFMRWMKGLNLAYMTGAIVLDGGFYRDRKYEALDWDNYWEKPDSYFK